MITKRITFLGRILLSGGLLCFLLATAHGSAIALWNFNSQPPDGAQSSGSTSPATGSGTAALVGGITGGFASGCGADPASSDNSGWQTKSYPSATNNNLSAGVQFSVDTSSYENISISWWQQNSGTASKYFRLQFTLDGNNYVNADVITITAATTFQSQSVNLGAVTGARNNPLFGFRIVSEWESTATQSGTNAYVATGSGSNYGTTGTVRFDMMTISGTVIPGSNTAPTITAVSNQTIRVSASTGPLPFTVADAEDAASTLTLAAASSNPSVLPASNISFAGFGADRTVNLTALNQPGSSLITLYVIDPGGKSNSTSLTVTVLPSNTAPSISTVPRVNTLSDSATPAIGFTVSDLESPASSLTVSGVSANPSLVPNSNLIFGGSGSNRTLTITPATGQTGVAPITVTVSDGTNTTSTVFPLMVVPSANVLFQESFEYSDGSLLTNSTFLWDNRSGTLGQCQVTNGQLLVTAALTEDVVGALIGGPYAISNHTALYARFKLTVLSLPKLAPGYFAHFGDGSTLRGRVYASISNSAAGSFRLLVANGTGAPVEMPTDLATNTSYTVVTRYNLDTATSTLWLNPAAETDPGVTGTDSQTAAAIANYGFRQDTDLGGAYLVDDLAVGLTFASVVASGSPSRIPLLVSRSGANIVLQWSNPAFVLQSAPQAGGQYTNVPGASSPFTTAPNGPARFFRLKPN